MGNRLTKIYTRTGDSGTTSLDGKHRISKSSLHIDTVGTVDELNCAIGMVLALGITTDDVRICLLKVQNDLFDIGGELCPPHRVVITAEKISYLEKMIDDWNENLPPLKEFILPGGNPASAACHLARAICRRAERLAVALYQDEIVSSEILKYLNRLSDMLFVAARMVALETRSDEILWEHERKKS